MKPLSRTGHMWTIFAVFTLLFSSLALATDFSSMTTKELARMRGTLCAKSQEEREAFRQEWQKRMAQITPDERRQYAGCPNRHGKNCMSRGCMNGKEKCKYCGCGKGRSSQ